MPDDERERRPDGAVAVVRRAPFSDNPRVGVRGQRTQQRILDAALQAFGEQGYHGCSIDRITKLARCSRVSFYQYFASKEDVFRQLAGQVARQVQRVDRGARPAHRRPRGLGRDCGRGSRATPRSTRATSRSSTRSRATTILAAVAGARARRRSRGSTPRLATTTLPPRQLDPVIRLLLECLNHTLDVSGHPPLGRAGRVPERAGRDRRHRRRCTARCSVCAPT